MRRMHDETRIRLPNKFDVMFLRKGFYLFLNTAKPDKILFFLFDKPTFQMIFPRGVHYPSGTGLISSSSSS